MYKCINGLINHDVDLIRQDILHRHNTHKKGNLRLPQVKRNWGMQRTQYHAISDFNSLSQTTKDSRNVKVSSIKMIIISIIISILSQFKWCTDPLESICTNGSNRQIAFAWLSSVNEMQFTNSFPID